ncbi:MAG: SDR family oxidoreductase [Spirochaetia bacterium]
MSHVDNVFGLEDVRAVVTGGAGTLCGAIAEFMARAGASVSIWGRGKAHPVQEAVDAMIEKLGPGHTVSGETVDTGDEAAVEEAMKRTAESIGPPNLLVNGAGGNMGKGPFVDMDTELFAQIVSNNLLGGLVVPTKVFARYWIAAKIPGSIINLASMAGYLPLSGVWAYGAAKSAVVNLTYATAKEFAPNGIRVNAIAPGFFIGNQNRALLIADDDTGELTPRGQAIIGHTPFGRFGAIDDLEGTTLFLASPKASGFLTGVVIPVDGGYLIDNI